MQLMGFKIGIGKSKNYNNKNNPKNMIQHGRKIGHIHRY
jgi:hypothetical protein